MTGLTPHRLNGLDGIRALAVLSVMFYHFGVPGFSGGWVGPDIFFVLSGFLITTLLVGNHGTERSHPRWLRDFWVRRVRRLYPALLFFIAGLVAIAALLVATKSTIGAAIDPQQLRSESLSSLGYYSNWLLINQHVSYFGTSMSLLKHTWTLAIEEQFYIVFPLMFAAIMLARKNWRRLGIVVASAGAALSAGICAASFGHVSLNVTYYSTQTNAYHLLIGVALAFAVYGWHPSDRVRKLAGRLALPAVAGIAALVALGSTGNGAPRSFMFTGGCVALDLLTALLIVALVYGPREGAVSRAFNIRPIVWIGVTSYSIYLWHYPIAVLLTRQTTGLSGPVVLIMQILLSLAAGGFSSYFVEKVVRRQSIQSRKLRWSIYGVSALSALCLVIATPALLQAVA